MTLTMGQQLALRRIKAKEPAATAPDVAARIHAAVRDVAAALNKDAPCSPVFRGKAKSHALRKTKTASDTSPFGPLAGGVVETPSLKIPRDVLLDRERRMALSPHSITASCLGDPLPGYSELDKRRGV